jgi:hypothetical protein
MTTGYGWNWSWVADQTDTKNTSGVVHQSGGTIFSFRTPTKGALSASDLNAFSKSVAQNQQQVRSDWRTYAYPILNSLPSGNTDLRWSTSIGQGLPAKIDCFTYGLQGTTLFVFNDADDTKADGRYWDSNEFRPKTIAESFEDIYDAVHNIETGITETSSVDLDPLWASIGEEYRTSSFRSSTGSLHSRTSSLETHISQLNTDIYEPSSFSYELGTPLPYSIASMLDEILKIHEVSGGWGSDPSGVGHGSVTPGAHTHPYTEIGPPPAASETQDRTVGTFTHLDNEVKRLRYEIQKTRGSTSWETDATDPVSSTAGSLSVHMGYHGTGTVTSTNPHGIGYSQIDDSGTALSTMVSAIVAFTGMTNYTDSSPTYSSVLNVSSGDSLETAIGKLDAAVGTGNSLWERKDATHVQLVSSTDKLTAKSTLEIEGYTNINIETDKADATDRFIYISNKNTGTGDASILMAAKTKTQLANLTADIGIVGDVDAKKLSLRAHNDATSFVEIVNSKGVVIEDSSHSNALAAGKTHQLALGRYSRTQWNGAIVNAGDSLSSGTNLYTETLINQTLILDTDGSSSVADKEMFINADGTGSLEFEEGQHAFFKIRIMGAYRDTYYTMKGYEVDVVVRRDTATMQLNASTVTTVATIGVRGDLLTPVIALDTVNHRLVIKVGSSGSQDVRWVAEVSGPMIKDFTGTGS